MKPKNIPISLAEYEILEYPFGWKAEYWDGQAHLIPQEVGVTTRLDLTPRLLTQPSKRQQHTLSTRGFYLRQSDDDWIFRSLCRFC